MDSDVKAPVGLTLSEETTGNPVEVASAGRNNFN